MVKIFIIDHQKTVNFVILSYYYPFTTKFFIFLPPPIYLNNDGLLLDKVHRVNIVH